MPFDRQHAHHLARHLLHTDALAEGISRTKQVGDHRLPEHAHFPPGSHIVLREEGPAGHAPAADCPVRGGDPAHLGGPILVTVHDLDPQIHVRGDLRQEGDLLLDRVQVPEGQALGPMGAGPHPIDITVAGFNPDNVLAQTADLVLDLSRGTLADRHTAEEGAHPDTDAQGRKHAAQHMAHEGAQGDVQDHREARPCGMCLSGRRWHHTPPLLSRRLLRHDVVHGTTSPGPHEGTSTA